LNEELILETVFQKMSGLLGRLDRDAEVIFVNDGSTDQSARLLDSFCSRDDRFKVIHFSRNFGHQIAISAGLDHCQGSAAIIMDSDLQDPPEVVIDMIAKWKAGSQVVHAVRTARKGESFFKKITANLYYRLLKFFTDVPIIRNSGDFRLVDRTAIDAFKSMREKNRYIRGMFAWVGFQQDIVYYVRDARIAGETKFNFRKMARFALDGIISFSTSPIRIMLRIGAILAGIACAGIVYEVFGAYAPIRTVLWCILLGFGLQLMATAMVGFYVVRILDETRNRPLYVIARSRGIPIAKGSDNPNIISLSAS